LRVNGLGGEVSGFQGVVDAKGGIHPIVVEVADTGGIAERIEGLTLPPNNNGIVTWPLVGGEVVTTNAARRRSILEAVAVVGADNLAPGAALLHEQGVDIRRKAPRTTGIVRFLTDGYRS
jgi:hypothetical protein